MSEELKPCPFDVGDRDHKVRIRDNGRDGCGPADTWWAQCKCGAEGPNARSPEEAGLLWNRRASPTPEAIRREASPEQLSWRESGRARVIDDIAKKMDLYDPRVGDMIRALKEDHP